MRVLRGWALSFSMVALLPAAAFAQTGSFRSASGDGGSSVAETGPTVENARLGVSAPVAAADPASAEPIMAWQTPRQRQGIALMAVGGAALLLGLIIGDDAGTAIAVGGAVIGLVGLYQYLR